MRRWVSFGSVVSVICLIGLLATIGHYYEQGNTPAIGLTIVIMIQIIYTLWFKHSLMGIVSEFLQSSEIEAYYVEVISKLRECKDLRPWEIKFVTTLDPDKFRYWTIKQKQKLKEIGNREGFTW